MPQTTRSSCKRNGATHLGELLNNDALATIKLSEPYVVSVTTQGVSTMLCHRWSDESVEAKAKAAKGSTAKRTDDIDSYVYRNNKNEICIPGSYLYGTIADKKGGAAKYRQDPRSPRKSALDLYRAGVVVLTELASLGIKDWDHLDRRRVVVNNSGITRVRPAILAGWEATFEVMVQLPEYITPTDLLDVIAQGGKLCGFGDFRPTYGRFCVTRFDLLG